MKLGQDGDRLSFLHLEFRHTTGRGWATTSALRVRTLSTYQLSAVDSAQTTMITSERSDFPFKMIFTHSICLCPSQLPPVLSVSDVTPHQWQITSGSELRARVQLSPVHPDVTLSNRQSENSFQRGKAAGICRVFDFCRHDVRYSNGQW